MMILEGYILFIMKISVAVLILFFVPVISSFIFMYILQSKSKDILGFGSGIILSYVFVRIIPEVYYHGDSDFSHILMFGGVVLSLLFDKLNFFKKSHLTGEDLSCWKCEDPFRIDFSLALAFHYLLDGFFLGGYMITSEKLLLSSLPVLVHKFVDGFILSISFGGQKKSKSLSRIALISLSNIGGLIVAFLGISVLPISKIFSPIAGGILIYVAIHDFIPALNSIRDFVSFVLGAAIPMILLGLSH